jgi:ribonuclease HI
MRIINWCAGGLGNRLKPLGSCALMALESNRTLAIQWKPALRCMAKFEDLYANDIQQIDLNSLDPDTVSLYTDASYVHHEMNLNGNSELLRFLNHNGCKHFTQFDEILNDPAENVIIYNNDLCGSKTNISTFLHTLIPLPCIQDKIINFCQANQIDKSVIGIHARGTDFNVDVGYYINQIASLDANRRLYVCSDSQEFENAIRGAFGPRVIANQDKVYVSKERNGGWVNNVKTPVDSVQDSLVDLHILAKTDFLISHPNSTFAHIAKYMA